MADPNQYDPTIAAAAQEWGQDPTMLKALMLQESGGQNLPANSAGAAGTTQIIPSTAAGLGMTDPKDPTQQIFGAAKYLSQGMKAEGTPEGALLYYHGGPNWRQNYGPESAGYVPGVAAHYAALTKAATANSSQTGGTASAAVPSDADFLQQTAPAASVSASPAPTVAAANSPSPAAAPGVPSDADFLAQTSATPAAPPSSATTSAPAAAGPTPSPAPTDPSATAHEPLLARLGAGIEHGLMTVPDTVAKAIAGVGAYVDNKIPALASLDASTGYTPSAVNQSVDADQAAYKAKYGNDTAAAIGNVGGQIVGTLPIMSGIGGALGAAGDALGVTGGNLLTRAAGGAVSGAVQGAGAAAATSSGSDAPIGNQLLGGALTGGIVGGALPAIGSAARGLLSTATGIGASVDPEIARLAGVARDMGIPVSAPQMSGNSLLRIANDQSSKLPFSGADGLASRQADGWNGALAKQMGETATRVTPDVMDAAATRIGATMNGVAARTTIQADQPVLQDLQRIAGDAKQTLPASEQAPINGQITSLLNQFVDGNGALDGKAYQALTARGAPLDRLGQSADPNLAFYGQQIRNAVDDAFQRSADPADQAALTEARGQWRAMKTIQPLVEKSPDGNLSPALLMGQVRSASNRFDGSTSGMAYTGGGPMGDLARIGQAFLKAPPDSGTAGRMMVNSLVGGAPLGAVVAGANPLALAAAPVGLAANRLLGSALRSGFVANNAINSGLGQAPIMGGINRLLGQAAPYVAPGTVIGRNQLMP